VLSYREEAQIKEYWLSRNPNLKRELGGRIRRRKAAMYSRMILTAMSDIFKNRNRESVKEFRNLVKYLLAAKTNREKGK